MIDRTYEAKLRACIADHSVDAELLLFEVSCHSVAEATEAAGVTAADIVKSICMICDDGTLVVGVVKGEDKVSRSRMGKALGVPMPRLATPDEILARTGYPCGGTPPFGFAARFVIDERVFERPVLLAGGGSETALLRMTPEAMGRANGAVIARIRK